jgi:hypothetical protein
MKTSIGIHWIVAAFSLLHRGIEAESEFIFAGLLPAGPLMAELQATR